MDKVKKMYNKWSGRTDGNKIRAICKPCWELLYCPYGSLVESFKISYNDYYSCRIFGHECPVFTVAEPFTETREFRRIDREIPRNVQLKVFKRDGQVCQMCNQNVKVEDIHYDHIIPWSKGGSSKEDNIRLVCSSCNQKRGNDYEDDFLVLDIKGHQNDLPTLEFDMISDLVVLSYIFNKVLDKGTVTDVKKIFLDIIETEDKETDEFMFDIISAVVDKINNNFLGKKVKSNVLKFRWGFNGENKSIVDTCKKFSINTDVYIKYEKLLTESIGFKLNVKKSEMDSYIEYRIPEEMKKYIDELFFV